MFERIVLRRSEDGQHPTLGDLAEAMLFYHHVHLVLDRSSLFTLVPAIGIEQLTSLLRTKKVSPVYCRDQIATQTQQIGALAHHHFITIEMAGRQEKPSQKYTTRDEIEEGLRYAKKYSGRMARKLAEQFLDVVPVKRLSNADFLGGKSTSLVEAATADMYDKHYLAEAIGITLKFTPGFTGLSSPLALEVQPTHAGFTIFSNLSLTLQQTNDARAQLATPLGPVSVADLLTQILTARSDMLVAAHYGSDFRTSLVGTSLLHLRCDELLRRSAIHSGEISQFQQVIVNEGRALKEVIDSGERSFGEFLKLMEKGRLFQDWASNIHPDSSVVAEYFKESSRVGWVGSLPSKMIRFALGTFADSLLQGAGTAFSLADSFLIDKFAKGWRPNHFVDKRLKPFVNG